MLYLIRSLLVATLALVALEARAATFTYQSLAESIFEGTRLVIDTGEPTGSGAIGDSYLQLMDFAPIVTFHFATATAHFNSNLLRPVFHVNTQSNDASFVEHREVTWLWDDTLSNWFVEQAIDQYAMASASRTDTFVLFLPIENGDPRDIPLPTPLPFSGPLLASGLLTLIAWRHRRCFRSLRAKHTNGDWQD